MRRRILTNNDIDLYDRFFNPRHLPFYPKKKVCSSDGRTLAYWAFFSYFCTSNRKKASLVPDVGLNRRQAPVVNDDQKKGKK